MLGEQMVSVHNKLQSFVNTINSRINRVTGLARNKVSAKQVTQFVSQVAELVSYLVRKPKMKPGHKIRIAREDLPLEKRYKQRLTDEVFQGTTNSNIQPTGFFAGWIQRGRPSREALRAKVDKNLVEIDQFDIYL